ncbi:MAG: mannose-6-phosphate isomerase, class I [Halochromatium sp.]
MDSPLGQRAFIAPVPTAEVLQAAVDAFTAAPGPLRLHCGVQHYSWGDADFIPALIDVRNPGRLPFAELWIGAHPDLLSTVRLDGWHLSLAELIAAAPRTLLGAATARHFGNQLPFLLKVLAAREPLSIQVHPSREQALAGYRHEDAIGLALSDPRRSYRDCNHKPELLVALTDFYALRGFRPLAEIGAQLAALPELDALARRFEPSAGGLSRLYRWLMELEQGQVDALLSPVIARFRQARARAPFDPSDRRDWIIEADRLFSTHAHRDRGLFSLLLLNLIALHPGEALFLPAGELHAYLRGAAIEVMANSNNVLRGGLTRKHIDVAALLRTLRVGPATSAVRQPQPGAAPSEPETYPTPAAEFLLERHRLGAGEWRLVNPGFGESAQLRLGLVLDGQISVHSPGQAALGLERGATFVIPAVCRAAIHGAQRSLVFTARVPDPTGMPAPTRPCG